MVSLINLIWTEDGRSHDAGVATFQLDASTGPERDNGLYQLTNAGYWEGIQYIVRRIEQVNGQSSVLPPGIDHMLRPGEAVVSPRLAQLIATEPEMAQRYPVYTVLTKDGFPAAGDLIAFVRPTNREALLTDGHPAIHYGYNKGSTEPSEDRLSPEPLVKSQSVIELAIGGLVPG